MSKRIKKFCKVPDFYVVAVTGGPCGGKTTLINEIRKYSNTLPNVKIFIVNEAATTVHECSISYKDCQIDANLPNVGQNNCFQDYVIEEQIHAEDRAKELAKNWKKLHPEYTVIVICDRGIMDGEAYFNTPEEFYNLVLKKYNYTSGMAYERYHLVIHMRSVAVDRPEFYQTNDGTPRNENTAEAKKLDKKVSAAWAKHPHHVTINNKSNVYDKLNNAMQEIFGFCKVDLPHEFCERFIIDAPDFSTLSTLDELAVIKSKTFFVGNNHKNLYSSIKMSSTGKITNYYFNEQRWETMPNNFDRYAAYDTSTAITPEEFLSKLAMLTPNVKPLSRFTYTFYIGTQFFCKLTIYSCNTSKAYIRVYSKVSKPEEAEKALKSYFCNVYRVTYCEDYNEYNIAKTDGNILNL